MPGWAILDRFSRFCLSVDVRLASNSDLSWGGRRAGRRSKRRVSSTKLANSRSHTLPTSNYCSGRINLVTCFGLGYPGCDQTVWVRRARALRRSHNLPQPQRRHRECVTAPGMPMASSIALAITAPTALMPPSPPPLRPSGLRGLGASSVIRTRPPAVAERRPEIIGEGDGERGAVLAVGEFFEQRAAEALHGAADELALRALSG